MSNQIVKQLVVDTQAAMSRSQHFERVALFNPDGTVLTTVQTSAAMVLTGYAIAGSAAAVSASDTLNVALGKLEKRIAVLEAA